jgi:hypothetical protein
LRLAACALVAASATALAQIAPTREGAHPTQAPLAAGWGLAGYAGVRGGSSGFESSDTSSAGTPLVLRTGAAYALAFEAPYDDHRLLQLYLAHQRTRLRLAPPGDSAASAASGFATGELPLAVSTLHLGGVNYFEGPVGRGPFVVGGLGLTHLSPNLPGTSARTRWSMHIGIGHEWMLARLLSLRVELRGHATLLRSEGGFFCSGGCTVFIRGDTLTQVEGLVGLRVGF